MKIVEWKRDTPITLEHSCAEFQQDCIPLGKSQRYSQHVHVGPPNQLTLSLLHEHEFICSLSICWLLEYHGGCQEEGGWYYSGKVNQILQNY